MRAHYGERALHAIGQTVWQNIQAIPRLPWQHQAVLWGLFTVEVVDAWMMRNTISLQGTCEIGIPNAHSSIACQTLWEMGMKYATTYSRMLYHELPVTLTGECTMNILSERDIAHHLPCEEIPEKTYLSVKYRYIKLNH